MSLLKLRHMINNNNITKHFIILLIISIVSNAIGKWHQDSQCQSSPSSFTSLSNISYLFGYANISILVIFGNLFVFLSMMPKSLGTGLVASFFFVGAGIVYIYVYMPLLAIWLLYAVSALINNMGCLFSKSIILWLVTLGVVLYQIIHIMFIYEFKKQYKL